MPNCVLGKGAKVSASQSGVMFTVKKVSNASQNAMQCVGIDQMLQKKYASERIDLVSLDIEGNEPSVSNCWFLETVNTTMFLVETKKDKLNMGDFFFHRNGYINAGMYTKVNTVGTSFN